MLGFPRVFDEDEKVEYISFQSEDIVFDLSHSDQSEAWITAVVEKESKKLGPITFIFCSDNYLHQLNVQYLRHDTLTDIITFPYGELPEVSGDIFISVERVAENAKKYAATFEQELSRVMVHGVLHLCGYKDKTPAEQQQMRAKEDEMLLLKESF
ncbi:MAG TPA: rRNA maturation RNase YbeY [Saprospiraceae bacterium]|nr:rRNA maturation RNase YbeY [Saprospiraceae bacterium]